MDLRIMCDAFVEVKDAVNIIDVKPVINNYNLDKTILSGNVNIAGKYTKIESLDEYFNNELTFEKEVPFTLVFKNENYQVEKMEVEDFKYYEVVNQGIKCDFEIVVYYKENKSVDKKTSTNQKEEIKKDKIDSLELLNENNINENNSNDLETYETKNNDNVTNDNVTNSNVIIDFENSKESFEETIEEIKEKYDELLDKIFRTDIQEEDKKEDSIEVRTKKSETVDFSKFKESKSTYRVYYPKEENEIEKLCNIEQVSINSVYASDCNKDFNKKRRIIIKK